MAVATTDVDKLAEEYESEKPGRRLDPIHEKIVLVACAVLAGLYLFYLIREVVGIVLIAAFFALSNRLANVTAMRPNDEFYLMGRLPK